MNATELVEALRGRQDLARFNDEELRALVETAQLKTLHAGDPLWTPDQVREHAFILIDGAIEQALRSHSGRLVRQFEDPGQILSLSSLVHPWPYNSSAFATQRTLLLALSRERFQKLFAERQAVAYKLVDAIGEYLVHDMRDANQRLHEVFGRPAETLRMLRRRVREDTKA